MNTKEIKKICSITSTPELLETMSNYAGKEDDPFKEKVYRMHLTDTLDLEFFIVKATCLPAFPVFLSIDACTDVKKLVFDMINSKGDRIDFTQQMLAFGMARKSFSQAVKEFGYFGDDPMFYEGIIVHKKIVLKEGANYVDVTDNMINTISEVEIKKDEDNGQ